jgi:hypothetical protein
MYERRCVKVNGIYRVWKALMFVFFPARALAIVAASGLVLAGCGGGGSSGVSAKTYAASVCKATATWADTARAQSQQIEQQVTVKLPSILSAGLTGQSNALVPFRTSLVTFIGNIVGATKTYRKQIGPAGTPDVKNGSTLAAGLNAAVNKLVAGLTALRGQTQQIPTDSGPSFQQAASAIGTKVQSDSSGFESNLSVLNSAQLTGADRQTPACATLNTSG